MRPERLLIPFIAILGLLGLAGTAAAQSVRLLHDAGLQAERGGSSPPVAQLAVGQRVDLQQLAGGWARVGVDGRSGWVRASKLDLAPAETAPASRLDSGRRAAGASATTLGVRTLPPRASRHALIIGVGHYRQDPGRPVSSLPGVKHDMGSALTMAALMQVPPENITLLRDTDVTRDAVRQALAELAARVRPGDRVFLYWSGHGSRYFDPQEQGCVETLVPHDLRDIGNREFAQWLTPVSAKADKLLVVYDACHSGGVGSAAAASRSLSGPWVPKTTPATDACQQPRNVRTRSLVGPAATPALSGQDVVHLSSSRPDELSFDNPDSGGLATSSLLACLKGEARDLDGSGAVSVDELAACAQQRVDQALRGHPQLDPPHLVVSGNRQFVPAWLADAGQPGAPVVPASSPAELPVARVLEHLHAQRDGKRRVEVRLGAERLRVGIDALDFSITSSHDGHVYVALLGSDRRSLVLLFPNELDRRNRIAAGETMLLPRPDWRLTAGGPAGENTLLVMVSDTPRDLSALGPARSGPFARPLTDADGRARLQWLLGRRSDDGHTDCRDGACSDAFGAALLTIQEE